jgi:hypothetical protein
MHYAVYWSARALNQLTDIWLASSNRNAVTTAAHALEARLTNNPNQSTFSFAGGMREIHVSPLRALFRVDDTNRIVRIMRVTTDQPFAKIANPNGQPLSPS